MSKEKDPAFLFYPKDWKDGTAEFMPDEKGVYIDLLCYQHQHKGLPVDPIRLARIVGLSQDEFNRLWEIVSQKFEREGERLVNRKLQRVMQERADRGHTNRIIGIFSGLLRKGHYSDKDYLMLKKAFNVSDFLEVPDDDINDAISEWISERLSERSKSIGNGNGNKDDLSDKDVIDDFVSFQENITNIDKEKLPF